MRFLIDAQLPRRFCTWITDANHDVKHTLDLPQRNRTPDGEIVEIAEREDRIVVTKDDDFVQSFMINNEPSKLLLITTGNISNVELEKLVQTNLKTIINAFERHRFVELGSEILVIHE